MKTQQQYMNINDNNTYDILKKTLSIIIIRHVSILTT
ncbi:hypothetical protein GJS26_04414 [Pectobacterium carotovorum subsp. carotovorum]|nr:hypothetical protein [Pectobacterium carotovorum subsp. carotovorum]